MTLVVISYYDRRPIQNLRNLLESMLEHDAGATYRVCIVVNRTSDRAIELEFPQLEIDIFYRHNIGMNIGAWDFGWRACADYQNVIFLQDDCYIIRKGWVKAFNEKLRDPMVGMVGESLNYNWDFAWEDLRRRESTTKLPEHEIEGKIANRVDVYLNFMGANGIPPGNSALHLRSLSWALRREVLVALNGFPLGKNFGECIAAEIGVSKNIEAMGLKVSTVESHEFAYIKHVEWNQDYPGGGFSKNPVIPYSSRNWKMENGDLSATTTNTSWNYILQLVKNKLVQNIRNLFRRGLR